MAIGVLEQDLPAGLDREGRDFLRPIAACGVPYIFERSRKFVAGRVESRRFLVTMARAALGPGLDRLLAHCFGEPLLRALADRIEAALVGCGAVHFGFEVSRGQLGHKVYFEYAGQAQAAAATIAHAQPALVHRAFKWRSEQPDDIVETHYALHGSGDCSCAERIRALADTIEASPALAIGAGLAELATSRAPDADQVLLMVTEPGRRRRSFDLQLYDAGLRVSDAVFALRAHARTLGFSPTQLAEALVPVSGARLGHVAGGVDRQDEPFVTLYFAPERR